jgi:pimeloyl-ACP methyl ester carboxylesterase
MSYVLSGTAGAPLVLCLHGFPDIPRTWAPLTERLVDAGYRVASPWLPGYAPSSLRGPFDVPALAEKALALAEELAPAEPIRIVGHDWGAVIAQCALAREPARFAAAAILAIPHLLSFEANLARHPRQLLRSAYMGLFQLPVVSDGILGGRNFRFVERLWAAWSPGFDPGPSYFEELRVCLRASMPAPLEYYRALAAPAAIRELRRILAAGPLVVPTLYLHGERDGCIGPEMAEGQEAGFSALFEPVIVAEAGHFLHLERPEVTHATIVRWFAEH